MSFARFLVAWRIFSRTLLAGVWLLSLVVTPARGTTSEPTAETVDTVAAYRLPDDPNDLLRIDNEMKAFFEARIQRSASVDAKLDDIIDAIFGEKGLHFRYESDGVYSVGEAFRRRRGNCLTFSFLVVAVAREFGIPAKFNEVTVEPRWMRTGKIVIASRHINVIVEIKNTSYELDVKLDDELPVSRRSACPVTDIRAFAGAYNGVGVQQLALGNCDDGLKLIEKATFVDPTYVAGWTNLGNALVFVDRHERAQQCFQRALTIEPKSLAALSGLASVCRKTGRISEAKKLERMVIRYRERNPYYLLSLARDELAKGKFDTARSYLKRALNLKDNEVEFYQLMAEVARGQGHEKEAKRWLEKSKKVNS
ncbi:MAG: transglutaminase domain-containing protein [Nibricoccus sp.]